MLLHHLRPGVPNRFTASNSAHGLVLYQQLYLCRHVNPDGGDGRFCDQPASVNRVQLLVMYNHQGILPSCFCTSDADLEQHLWLCRYVDPVMATGWHMLLGGLPLMALSIAKEGQDLGPRLQQLTGMPPSATC